MGFDSRHDEADFHFTSDSPEKRACFRVAPCDLFLRVHELQQALAVRDISTAGCCLDAPAARFSEGRILGGDLYVADAAYLTDLRVKVVRRITENRAACSFQNLTHQQELALDKLVLETQKRDIGAHFV
jgi:hypothetical protein